MDIREQFKRWERHLPALLAVAGLCLCMGLRYDHFYDLNDDVVMKDILSGRYTGTPEGHNIQMLYPLGWLIACLYRFLPEIPVYGVFLLLCQYGCIWAVIHRSTGLTEHRGLRWLLAAVEAVAAAAWLGSHLIFVQYTFTSAMLAATAAFLFMTGGKNQRQNLSCILLAVLSYLLRTEMLLLLLPMIGAAGLYRWSLEEQPLYSGNVIKYVSVIGGILLGMGAASLWNRAAYNSPEWKAFMHFFDMRTQLYDFQGIPSYEANQELYRQLGLSEAEQSMLLDQYNFGLEDSLDGSVLEEISNYQSEIRTEEGGVAGRIVQKLKLCLYRLFRGTAEDQPWNLLVVLLYPITAAAAMGRAYLEQKKQSERSMWKMLWQGWWKLALLGSIRMALWIFILMLGRDPVRITHSLYLMEALILAAMLQMELYLSGKQEKFHKRNRPALMLSAAVCLLAGGMLLGSTIRKTDWDYQARKTAAEIDRAMKDYCLAHPENFYFMDVYATVSYPLEPYASTPYSELLLQPAGQCPVNYDLMGGWLVKSPLYQKKLAFFGMDSMREALLQKDHVYVMAELDKGTGFLQEYFRAVGQETEVIRTDSICDLIGVYQVKVLP